jgi:hypothetical protein
MKGFLVSASILFCLASPLAMGACPGGARATPDQCVGQRNFMLNLENEYRTAQQNASMSSAYRDALPGYQRKINEGWTLYRDCGCGEPPARPASRAQQ